MQLGDAQSPDIRARLVACEVNHDGTREDSYFASTPPLEAKRMLFAKFADSPRKNGVEQRLSFVDVRKAYFNGIPRRNLFMSLPREFGLAGHLIGRQVRCVYGTRDAGAIWEDTYRDLLESIGFASGKASPCVFYNAEHDISTVVHGDDFTSLASDVALTWMEDKMAEHFELKLRGRLGRGCEGELRILNRIVRVTRSGLEYEADPRHVELVSESLELTGCKPVVSPGIKNHEPELESKKSEDSTNFSMKADNGMSDMIDVYMALTSDNPCVAISPSKSVTFNEDSNTSYDVIAYSEVCGSLPFTLFATVSGWKKVGPRVNPYTGKSSEVMSARLAARARRHDRERINRYRNVMIRTVNGKLANCTTLLEPKSIGAFIDSMANRDAPCHASMTECEAASFMSESPDLEISHPHDCIAAVGESRRGQVQEEVGRQEGQEH